MTTMKKTLTILMLALAVSRVSATLNTWNLNIGWTGDATAVGGNTIANNGLATPTLYTGNISLNNVMGSGSGYNTLSSTYNAGNGDVASLASVVAMTVTLNVSGGYNGDLYAYLIAPDGTTAILINNADYASQINNDGSSVVSLTLADASSYAPGVLGTGALVSGTDNGAVGSAAAGTLTGQYNPYQNLNEIMGMALLNHGGVGVIGDWTLGIAYAPQAGEDANGNGDAMLTSWSLNLTVVPEPVDLALGIFAAMLLALAGVNRYWRPAPKAEAKLEA